MVETGSLDALRSLLGAGRLAEAGAVARAVLAADPDQPDALAAAGLAACVAGDRLGGATLLDRAASRDPERADIWVNLAIARADLDHWPLAHQAAETALTLDPASAEALVVRGNALLRAGQLQPAIADYLRAGLFRPDYAAAWRNMTEAYRLVGDRFAALAAAQRLLQASPNDPTAIVLEATIRAQAGDLVGAEQRLSHLLHQRPDVGDAWFHLAVTLSDQRRFEEAARAFDRALALDPGNPNTMQALAVMRKYVGRLTDARDLLERALSIKPDFPLARLSLAATLGDLGEVERSIAFQAETLAGRPGDLAMRSNYLMFLNYSPNVDRATQFAAHRDWGRMWAATLGRNPTPAQSFPNARDPDRRLRVGYLSPDFRTHSVSFFARPLFAAHDRAQVEVFAYCDIPAPDGQSRAIQAVSDHWRETSMMSDPELADLIARDRIDILVDLAGHTFKHRMTLFAARVAPVQVSWLGYPNTTGVEAIDYRLVDAIADPDGDEFHTEVLVRLPRIFLAYQPPAEAPEPASETPAARTGVVTFGAFHTQAKLSDPAVAAWARILLRSPGTRLLLKNVALEDPAVRASQVKRFVDHGVAAERIAFVPFAPTTRAALDCWNQVDLALDSFPYTGTTTLCEALWMATPVLTLRGDRHAARVGASILDAVGAPELIAETIDTYVDRAVALAGDLPQLTAYRQRLRPMVAASTLCDAAGLARAIEAAYRRMWHRWSAGEPATAI